MKTEYEIRYRKVSQEAINLLRSIGISAIDPKGTLCPLDFMASEAWSNGVIADEGPSVPPTEEVFFLRDGVILILWPGFGEVDARRADFDEVRSQFEAAGYNQGTGREAWAKAKR